jgi:predicted dehydrogenase
MKFLIAGLGSIGRRHLKNLTFLGQHDILLYRTHRSTLSDDELSDFPIETNLKDALAHQPDAVIVSNPTSLHLEVAIPAAQAGCHIFLEKPISHSLERIDEFRDTVISKGVQVFVGYQFRFHPSLKAAHQYLKDGKIGKPLSIRAHWGEYLPYWHPWEDYRQGYSARSDLGGGVTLTLSHPLDYLHWMIGDISELFAFIGKISDLELEVEDLAEISLRFKNGCIGSVHLDYAQIPATHNLEIIGSKGTIRWDNSDGVLSIFKDGEEDWEIIPAPSNFNRNQLFIAEMQHFINIVLGKTKPSCTLQDGIKTLETILAVQNSSKSGSIIQL